MRVVLVQSDSQNPGPASAADAAAVVARSRSQRTRRWIVRARASWVVVVCALAVVGLAVWSHRSGGIVAMLLARGVSAPERVRMIQEYFDSLGVVAPVVYVGLVMVEVVVAPIPGLMLYAPGGVVFGGFLGGLLSLIGNTLGAGIACKLIRVLGGNRFQSWFEQGRLSLYRERLVRAGLWVILLLRINPLTSSDLVSYAAGLAGIPVWKVMVGTMLGMAPLCWAQAYLTEGIVTAIPQLIYPLIVLCVIYAVGVVWVVVRMRGNVRKPRPGPANP
jgi:uncharacterized membrane protein YdjX (TVP38/TMEM64 family)